MLDYLRSYKKNSTDWVTRKCLSSLQKLESKSNVPARMVSPATSLLGYETATITLSLKGLSLCPYRWYLSFYEPVLWVGYSPCLWLYLTSVTTLILLSQNSVITELTDLIYDLHGIHFSPTQRTCHHAAFFKFWGPCLACFLLSHLPELPYVCFKYISYPGRPVGWMGINLVHFPGRQDSAFWKI